MKKILITIFMLGVLSVGIFVLRNRISRDRPLPKTPPPSVVTPPPPVPEASPSSPGANPPSPQGATYTPGDYQESIIVDGRTRTYLLHIPQGYSSLNRYPLVLLLHGGGGDAETGARMSGMSQKADKEGFVVAYPEGEEGSTGLKSWNAGDCCAYASRSNVDDTKFIRDLTNSIRNTYAIDPARIYIAGMSNGAMLTHRIACELSDIFTGAAAVAGTIQASSCSPVAPIPFVAFHGTADAVVPYNGGAGSRFTRDNTFSSVEQNMKDWAQRNGCRVSPVSSTVPPLISDGVTIDKISYSSCEDTADVILYRLNGGQHYWPGGESGRRQEAAVPTKSISATDAIWEFFKAHPRK